MRRPPTTVAAVVFHRSMAEHIGGRAYTSMLLRCELYSANIVLAQCSFKYSRIPCGTGVKPAWWSMRANGWPACNGSPFTSAKVMDRSPPRRNAYASSVHARLNQEASASPIAAGALSSCAAHSGVEESRNTVRCLPFTTASNTGSPCSITTMVLARRTGLAAPSGTGGHAIAAPLRLAGSSAATASAD